MHRGGCSGEGSQSNSERGRDAIAHDAADAGGCLSSKAAAVEGGLYTFHESKEHSYLGIYVGPHWMDLCYFLRLDMGESAKPLSRELYRRMDDLLELEHDAAADVHKFFCKLVPQHSPRSGGRWDLARAVLEIVPVTRLQRTRFGKPGFEFEYKCKDVELLRRFLNRSKRSRYSRTAHGHRQSYKEVSESAVKEAVVGRFYGARLCVTEVPKGKQKPRPCLVMRIFDTNKGEPSGKVLVLPVTSFSVTTEHDENGIKRMESQTLETVFEEETVYASKYFIPLRYPSDCGNAVRSNSRCAHVLVDPRLKYDEGYICACEYEMEVRTVTLLHDPDLDLVDGKHKCRSKVDVGGFHQVCEFVKSIDQFDGHGTSLSWRRSDRRGRQDGGNPGRRGGGNPGGGAGGNRGGGAGGNPGGGGGGGGNPGGGGGGRRGSSGGRGGGRRGSSCGRGGGRRGSSGGRGGGRRQHGRRQSIRNIHENMEGVSEQENTGGERESGGGSEGGIETQSNPPLNHHDQLYELIEDLDDLDWSWNGVSPWLPICNQQTKKFLHGFVPNATQTLDKLVLERLNQHMEYHLKKNTPSPNLREVNEGATSKLPLETLLDSSFEMLMNLMMEVIRNDTEDTDMEILHEVIEDLMKTIEDSDLKEKVNLSMDELEIVLKKEGKIPWKIIDNYLVECIKWEDVECCNEGVNHTFKYALSEEDWDDDDWYLECGDKDHKEKFLLKICFWTKVKVTHLIVKSPREKGPTTLELFVNKPHMGYGDEEKVTQIIELKPENLEGEPVKLEAWKFQSVESLQVRAKGLEGRTAQVTKFALIGSTKETTDASKLKRQCSMAYVLTQFGDSIK